MSHRLCKGHEATLGQRASQGRRHVRSSSAAAVPGGAGASWPGQLAISLISRAMLFFESKVWKGMQKIKIYMSWNGNWVLKVRGAFAFPSLPAIARGGRGEVMAAAPYCRIAYPAVRICHLPLSARPASRYDSLCAPALTQARNTGLIRKLQGGVRQLCCRIVQFARNVMKQLGKYLWFRDTSDGRPEVGTINLSQSPCMLWRRRKFKA